MKRPRVGLLAAGCVLAGAMFAMPQGVLGQAGGNGQAGPGHGPVDDAGRDTQDADQGPGAAVDAVFPVDR